jgi:hypothetical protein
LAAGEVGNQAWAAWGRALALNFKAANMAADLGGPSCQLFCCLFMLLEYKKQPPRWAGGPIFFGVLFSYGAA